MIRLAVIGGGTMGAIHCRVISEFTSVKLTAVCDLDVKKGLYLAKLYQTKYYSDLEKLLNNEDVDGIIIAVPTNKHKEIALKCIEYGKNILVEKPIASTKSDAKIICKAAEKKGAVLLVGHIERFSPSVLKLKQIIDDGDLGNIVSIVIKRVGFYPPRIKDVNVITDLAVHDLDIACYLMNNNPKAVYAIGGNGVNQSLIDYADIIMDFGNISCYIQINWMTPIKIRCLSITGTLGYAELDYISQKLIVYKATKIKSPPTEFNKFVNNYAISRKESVRIKHNEPLKLELINFINSIKHKETPKVSGEQGVRAIYLTELVHRSIEQKCVKIMH